MRYVLWFKNQNDELFDYPVEAVNIAGALGIAKGIAEGQDLVFLFAAIR